MNILVSGSTGLVGSALRRRLAERGHQVATLIRGRQVPGKPWWDPPSGNIDLAPAGTLDAVLHLAGENVASGRWTPEKKRRIRESRVDGSRLLAEAAAALPAPPKIYLQASAIGFYGDRGEEILDERSKRGSGFLAETCADWEAAGQPMEETGARVVKMRIGVVLDRTGGALKRMLPAFRLGLGGPVGGGGQYVSWITLRDLTAAVEHLLDNDSLSGPVNMVSPGAVPQRMLARALGKALGRPAFLPLPGWVVRLAFGEMGRDLLLSSTRVNPARLLGAGFTFRHVHIQDALKEL